MNNWGINTNSGVMSAVELLEGLVVLCCKGRFGHCFVALSRGGLCLAWSPHVAQLRGLHEPVCQFVA